MADFRNDSILKLIWEFTLPSLIGTLANTIYNIVDRIFIGQGVGTFAISGLALTFPIMNIMTAFGMLVGQGAAAEMSIRLGRRDHSESSVLSNMILLTFVNYLLVTVICYINLDRILELFGGSPNTIPYARQYLEIIIPGHFMTSLGFGLSNIIRSSGRPKIAMLTLVSGAALNILLDPFFIFVFDLGIRGAAIATVISMTLTTFLALYEVSGMLKSCEVKPDFRILFRIVSIGMSPFLLQICNSLVNVEMNRCLGLYGGDLAIGAFGIITSFSTLITMMVVGVNHGLQPIIGFNYGAGLKHRVVETLRAGMIIGTVITTLGWLLAMFCPAYIAKCFNSNDVVLIGMTANGLRFYCLLLGFVGFHLVITNYYQSIGRSDISILLTLMRQVGFLIPFILILPVYLPLIPGLSGLTELNCLWLAQPASVLCSVLLALIFLCHDKYLTKI